MAAFVGLVQTHELPEGKVLGLTLSGRARVAAIDGVLWVTGPGTGDVVLGAGDSVSVEGRGRIAVQALRAGCFRVEHTPSAELWLARWQRLLASARSRLEAWSAPATRPRADPCDAAGPAR